MVFLEKFYVVLLLAHLFATFILLGSMTHNLLIVFKYARGEFGREKREQYFGKIAFWTYTFIYTTGALIYPAFRVYMRHDYFDSELPWATGLFEVKEHWGAIGLALFVVYYFLRKNFQPAEEREKLFLYVPLCLLLNVIVWYMTVAGCYLSLLKGTW